jgi:hypothetical protein
MLRQGLQRQRRDRQAAIGRAAQSVEAESQLVLAATAMYAEADRFIAIVSIYASRACLGIYKHKEDEDSQTSTRFLKCQQEDDRAKSFPRAKLKSRSWITGQLIRNQNELKL